MRNLQKIYYECVQECKNAKIPIRDNKVIKIGLMTDELEDFYGVCYKELNNEGFSIYINPLLFNENCNIKELKETIIHELIHTCSRCWTHGKTWMKYANIMNNKYSYELTTIKDYDAIFNKEKPILHHYICPNCGSIYNTRTINECDYNPNNYKICLFCRSNYKKIY